MEDERFLRPGEDRLRVLAYARVLTAKFPAPTFLRKAVMGRGHVPRTRVNRQNELERMLPAVTVTEAMSILYDPEEVQVTRFVPTVIYEQFQTQLLAAGIDMKSQTIVDRRAWIRAAVVLRLTGHPPAETDRNAAQVSARIERRLEREEARLLRHRQTLES